MKYFNFNKKFKAKHGFTLVELLVAVVVVGTIMTLSIIYVRAAYFKAKDAQTLYNVKQLQTALLLYYDDHGSFPNGEVYINVDGMCLTENGFEICGGGVGKNGLINQANAQTEETAKRIYLSDIPKNPYGYEQYRYLPDQGGQWYTVFYKTKEAVKRVVPDDHNATYLLRNTEIRNWRIKTDVAEIVNMMNDFYRSNSFYPRFSGCFKDNKGCILVDGSYVPEEECNKQREADKAKIYFEFASISGRGFLGTINYCIVRDNDNNFTIGYDLETKDGGDSAKMGAYRSHYSDHFSSAGIVDLSKKSIFSYSFDKEKAVATGEFYHPYYTDYFKNGMKDSSNSDHGYVNSGR